MDLNNYVPVEPCNSGELTRHTIRVTANRERGIPSRNITWTSQPPATARRGPEDIMTKPRSLSEEAKAARTYTELWNLFFTESMLDKLVEYTNQKIDDNFVKNNYTRDRLNKSPHLRHTDKVEVKALIGLMYLRGMLNANLVHYRELWSPMYSNIFNATMSMNRFGYLSSMLRLDNKELRAEARRHDKFAAAREMMTSFNVQLAKHLQCGAYLSHDETLYPYRGAGFPFRMYIPGKPCKFGILYRSTNDSELPYTYQILPVAGKPEAEPSADYCRGAGESVVRNLRNYQESGEHELKGRQMVVDRGYTSYDVVTTLRDEFQMTTLGTIMGSRKGLPKEFTSTDRPEGSYYVLYEEDSRISIHSEIWRTKSG